MAGAATAMVDGNACTHRFSVTWHECSEISPHKQRDTALACLDLMIETMRAKCPPLAFEAKGD